MFLRSAMFVCATAMLASMAAPSFAEPAARCEETSFRVYFSQGSARLDDTAMEMLDATSRNVSQCGYAELHVALDASNPSARARGDAILAAANDRAWNVARVEQRRITHRASYRAGPEYAEVLMTPRAMATTNAPLATEANTGV